MLVTVGDLVDDVVVRLATAVHHATDTTAAITRRRGGSAATTAAVAARRGTPSRFVGRVGDDAVGAALVDELAADGVDVTHVQRGGSTGTIVVLVEPTGERSMLTDRGACVRLERPDPAWLDGATVVHVPLYSLSDEPLASTTRRLVRWAHARAIAVTLDLSSVAVLEALGRERIATVLRDVAPSVVLANADEGDWLGIDAAIAGAVTVVKHGPSPAIVHRPGEPPAEVPAADAGTVGDTTGAGDAFAAGYCGHLVAAAGVGATADHLAACRAGHTAAAHLLAGR